MVFYILAGGLVLALVAVSAAEWVARSAEGVIQSSIPSGTKKSGTSGKDDESGLDLVKLDEVEVSRAAAAVTSGNGAKVKRLFDIITSVTLLVFLAPLLVLTMLAIRIESKGPVFYLQKRVGFRGKVFSVIKFRSMRVGCGKRRSAICEPQ